MKGKRHLRVVELTQELLLVHDRVHTALGNHSGLQHLLHSVELLSLLLLYLPDLAKASSADHILESEVGLASF